MTPVSVATPAATADPRAGFRNRLTDLLPGLEALWEITQGDPGVTIAVLDGPVDLSHPCLEGAALRTLPGSVAETGESDHGTHVVSLLFGQPGTPVEGIAPRCTGLIAPIFRQDADGSLHPCSQQSLAQNVSQAIEAGANVINISGGELSPAGQAIDFLDRAVRQAAERDVLIVAAAGNQGCECLNVPAALPNVLSVGALERDGSPLATSNWSRALQGIMAPGSLIEGAVPGGGVGWMSGTSSATPLVSGIAALLLSALKQRGLRPSAARVRDALLAGARPCDPSTTRGCQRFLNGVLDVRGAWTRLIGPAADRDAVARTAVSVSPAAVRGGAPPSDPPTPSTKGVSMSESINPSVVSESEQAASRAGVAPAEAGDGDPAAQVAPSGASERPPETATPPRVEPAACGDRAGGERSAASAAAEPSSSPPAGPAGSAHGGSGIVAASESRPGVRPACQGQSMFTPFPPGQKVFTIGKLYYDFGTEARRDYFIAQIRAHYEEHDQGSEFNQGLVYDPNVMIRYLLNLDPATPLEGVDDKSGDETNADAANGLIWTSYIDQDPVYALVPEDQYAVVSFVRLVFFLRDQSFSKDPETFRIAVAGSINGSVTLFNGTVVPKLSLITRGMYDWDIEALVEATGGSASGTEGGGETGGQNGGQVDEDLRQFLLRVYDELRNLGVTADDRARNFAATNAYQARQAFVWANSGGRRFKLDGIRATRSPICRRNSDCWDIRLTFFDPQNLFQTARQVFEYTIDVSDIIPVQVGDPRVYPIYGGPNS